MIKRSYGRNWNELRPVSFQPSVLEFAAGSVLFEIGKTKILCAVTMQAGVPAFAKGTQSGWLTAEYALLPASTSIRTQRDSATTKVNGRAIEISRLIGRTLRSVVDLSAFPDRTIIVDCDVIQADGGTRTASITAASLALHLAQEQWLQERTIAKPFFKDEIAAVSIGVSNTQLVLDPDFAEDCELDADFNFVFTKMGNIIEVQGGCEKNSISMDLFQKASDCAQLGVKSLFAALALDSGRSSDTLNNDRKKNAENAPLFSLKNRGKFAF